MRRFIIFLLFIVIACDDSDKDINLGGAGLTFFQSKTAWVQLKEKNGNSYAYTVSFESWAGFGNSTTLTVRNGAVISRAYISYNIKDNGTREVTDEYSEGTGELGTHEQGAAVATIDDLYQSCVSNYLSVDDKKNRIYFDSGDYGIMSRCGYVPKNCADDCFRGISISEFEWR